MINKLSVNITRVILALGIVAGVCIGAVAPAAASGYPEVCAQAGSGYCLNDWNGDTNNGALVKMYNEGNFNNQFEIFQLTGYCNDGFVTSGTGIFPPPACPFKAGTGMNNEFLGGEIVEIYSPVADECLGTESSTTYADLGPCPPANGTGVGSNIWVESENSSCGGSASLMVNVYWSNHNSIPYYLLSGGSIGAQAYATYENYSCWGWLNQ